MRYAGLICWCVLPLLVVACGQKGKKSPSEDTDEVEKNKALYDQVMKVHDEVMPKMEDLHRAKSELQKQIVESMEEALPKAKAPIDSVKASIDSVINRLDSADKAMMDWMHQFKPLYDTVDVKQAREYLEDQMEKIKQVKKKMNQALEDATKKME